jgi:hypothetical protein
MSCNVLTGEVGPVVIPSTESVTNLAIGTFTTQGVYCTLAHMLNLAAVPARRPWTPSTNAQWPLSAQHSVHVAVAVLWKARTQGRQMQVPYELVDIILMHIV